MLLDPRRYLSTEWQGADWKRAGQDVAQRVVTLAKEAGDYIRGLRLGDLANVDLATPATDQQALLYNAAHRKWLAGTVSTSGGGGLPTSGFLAHNTAAISVTTTGNFTLPFDTQDYDYGNEFDPATGTWTPTTSGPYEVFGQVMLNTAQITTSCQYLRLVEDLGLGTERDAGSFFHGSIDNAPDGTVVPQKMGATIQVMITAGKTYNVVVGNLKNPTTVSPTETLFGAVQIARGGTPGGASYFGYYHAANYTVTSSPFTVPFETLVRDDVGEYDPVTGLLTPATSGPYTLQVVLFDSQACSASERIHVDLYQTSSGGVRLTYFGQNPTGEVANSLYSGTCVAYLEAGETYAPRITAPSHLLVGGAGLMTFAGIKH